MRAGKASCSSRIATCHCLQDKEAYLREVEGLVRDYEALAAEKDALEQQTAQHEGRHTQLGRELAQAQQAVQQLQQVPHSQDCWLESSVPKNGRGALTDGHEHVPGSAMRKQAIACTMAGLLQHVATVLLGGGLRL